MYTMTFGDLSLSLTTDTYGENITSCQSLYVYTDMNEQSLVRLKRVECKFLSHDCGSTKLYVKSE